MPWLHPKAATHVCHTHPAGGFDIPTRRTTSPTLDAKKPKLKDLIFASLDADKAEDIEVIEMKDSSALADYMIVATGRSSRQVSALADKLVDRLTEHGIKGVRVEGQRFGDWVVVDAIDIVVHIFRPEVREFYNIEKMWRAGSLFETVTANA